VHGKLPFAGGLVGVHTAFLAGKQSLAAIRMLFDWLVVGQVARSNPASVVRGPKHVVKRGKTPILDPSEARKLFDSIPTDSLVGLRDRALIGVLIYSFARGSRTISPRASAGGLGSTRRAASTTKCRCTIRLRSTLTAILRPRGFGTEPKASGHQTER